MYHLFNILFDDKTNEENLSFHRLEKNEKTQEYESILFTNYGLKPMGSFPFNFINYKFDCKKSFCDFVSNYCFEALYFNYFPYQIRDSRARFSITEEEYTKLLDLFYDTYSNEFCYYRDELYDLVNTKDRLDFFSYMDKTPTKKMLPSEYEKYNNVDIKEHLQNIKLNFKYQKYFSHTYKNVDFAYETRDFYSLLYLCMWKLTKIKNVVYVCKNCGKYFIPDYKYNVKYCNYIYSDNKTCKEIAAQLQYKKKLEAEPALKNSRTFYQSLQKNSSDYGGKYTIRYENFKKELKIMKKGLKEGNISVKEFNDWVNSKKLRK